MSYLAPVGPHPAQQCRFWGGTIVFGTRFWNTGSSQGCKHKGEAPSGHVQLARLCLHRMQAKEQANFDQLMGAKCGAMEGRGEPVLWLAGQHPPVTHGTALRWGVSSESVK